MNKGKKVDKIRIGKFNVYGLTDGTFLLDGGAMFGVVPKVLWEKKMPADFKNRILLSLNSILIDTGNELILVETGIGRKLNEKFIDIYGIKKNSDLIKSINKYNFTPKDVNFVINTHLHFDHCGGNTFQDEKRVIRPTFSNAKYIIQKGEWEHALSPNERDKASYLKENFLPLREFSQLELINGEKEIVPGVKVDVVPGHTKYHQCVFVTSENESLIFLGDLIPTTTHINLPYIMSYDLYPVETLENKKKILDKAAKEGWVLSFNHDPKYFFGRVKFEEEKFKFIPL
jgi:glyoxylase-like metal-dependent hydrolase (beta-lactamase superfamily II)